MRMHVLLVPFGSDGDVYPFIGLGTELAGRGHQVTVFASGYYRRLVENAGFGFSPYALQKDDLDLIRDPEMWHSRRSIRLLATRAILPTMPAMYRLILRHHRPGNTALVAGSLAFGARVAGETLGLPLTTVHLQPIVFRSRYAPAVYPGATWIRSLPRASLPAVFRIMDFLLDRVYAAPLNDFRSEFGLAPVTRVLEKWWHAPESILAFFPEWFAKRQPDWPAQVRFCGFPLYDCAELEESNFDVKTFLADSEPPIVFTAGSRMATGETFFAAAAEACKRLGRRALFITRFPEQLPKSLPSLVRHAEFVPFGGLLPGAAALVHHGGIGTASQALRASIPQLIIPRAHDQFDNAAHLERLGVSLTLPYRRFDAASIASALRSLIDNPAVHVNCANCCRYFTGASTLEIAANFLEEYWQRWQPS